MSARALAIAAALAPSLLVAADPSPIAATALDTFIEKTLAQYHVPGAAVAVIQDGQPLLVKAGKANYPGKIRHWDDNTFAVAWPIFISAPDEITFTSDDAPATGFNYEGYDFRRMP